MAAMSVPCGKSNTVEIYTVAIGQRSQATDTALPAPSTPPQCYWKFFMPRQLSGRIGLLSDGRSTLRILRMDNRSWDTVCLLVVGLSRQDTPSGLISSAFLPPIKVFDMPRFRYAACSVFTVRLAPFYAVELHEHQ